MTVGNIIMETTLLWVQIWGTPFDMFSPRVAKEVWGKLGEVKEVEWKRRKDDINLFMCVRVVLPISKPLRRGGFLVRSNGECSWVTFKYEWLPMFCHYCGILGHDLKHCAAHYVVEKNGGNIVYQYGDFLRAAGAQARGPAHQYSNPKSFMEEGASSGQVQDPVPVAESMQTTVTEIEEGNENPRASDKVEAKNLGAVMDSMQADGVICANCTNVEEHNSMAINPSPDIQLSLNGKPDLNTWTEKELAHAIMDEVQVESRPDGIHEHVPLNNQLSTDGARLSNTKPKTTWTRINIIDFGLNGLARAITLPTLGKRDMRDTVGEQIDESKNKRGKVFNEEGFSKELSVGLDSYPCWKQ